MAALLAVGQPPPPSPLQSPPMAATATATAQAPVARWTITLHDSVVRTATTAGLTNGGNGHVDTKQATKVPYASSIMYCKYPSICCVMIMIMIDDDAQSIQWYNRSIVTTRYLDSFPTATSQLASTTRF